MRPCSGLEMKPEGRLGLLIAMLLGAALGGWLWLSAPGGAEQGSPGFAPAAQATLSAQSLTDQQGRVQTLAQWRGRPVLINFWASWCSPCREEMPQFEALARQQAAHGVQVLGVAWDSPANVQAFLKDNPLDYPILIAGSGVRETLAALGNPAGGLPFTLLVDGAGQPQAAKLGAFRGDELPRWLAEHSAANGVKMK